MRKTCENAVLFLDPYVVKKDRGQPWLDCRDNYEWYYTYGEFYQPTALLEVGVRYGYSVLSICFGCKASPPRSIFLIDNDSDEPGSLEYATTIIGKKFTESEVGYAKADTQQLSSVFEDEEFDMIHIDANHKPDAVRHDFKLFWPRLCSGGVMILDDQRSLAGERSVPLHVHIMPWLMDKKGISSWTFINNYNCQLLIEKK